MHHQGMPSDGDLTFIGRTTFRNERRLFGIRTADRRHHMYVIGKTGTGKSTLLETLIAQDIAHGHGLALLDPHGDLVERVRARVPEGRREQVIDFDVANASGTLAFNPLERVPPAQRPLAAAGVLETFKKLWAEFWGPRTEHILRNALLALFDQPEATLADILRLLDEDGFRRDVARRVANPQVRGFWLREYESYPARFRVEAIAPLQNKVGAFLADPRLNRILTQPKSAFDVRHVMDDGQILFVNLSKGQLGEDVAALLGSLLVSAIGLAGLSRADTTEERRRDFFVYLDEFHAFTTLHIATMLSELRKYRVSLVLAHQYLAQLDLSLQHAILGNVGTLMSFRIGPEDADTLAPVFGGDLSTTDLTRLPNHHAYVRLLVDGAPVPEFSAAMLRL